jgi:hypothetical protein
VGRSRATEIHRQKRPRGTAGTDCRFNRRLNGACCDPRTGTVARLALLGPSRGLPRLPRAWLVHGDLTLAISGKYGSSTPRVLFRERGKGGGKVTTPPRCCHWAGVGRMSTPCLCDNGRREDRDLCVPLQKAKFEPRHRRLVPCTVLVKMPAFPRASWVPHPPKNLGKIANVLCLNFMKKFEYPEILRPCAKTLSHSASPPA